MAKDKHSNTLAPRFSHMPFGCRTCPRENVPRRLRHPNLTHNIHTLIYVPFSWNQLTIADDHCVKRDKNTFTFKFKLLSLLIFIDYVNTWNYIRVRSNGRNDAISQPNHTHIQCEKYVVHDTLTHCQLLINYYKLINYGHHAHRLSLIHVAPGHVNKVLAIDTGRIKPENPELKIWLDYSSSNGLMIFYFAFSNFILVYSLLCSIQWIIETLKYKRIRTVYIYLFQFNTMNVINWY